jgi:tetratricopeptide (TPR) repeat protein
MTIDMKGSMGAAGDTVSRKAVTKSAASGTSSRQRCSLGYFLVPFLVPCGNLFFEGRFCIDLQEELRVEDKIPQEERFLRARLSREDNQNVVRRLLAVTPRRSPQQNRRSFGADDETVLYDEAFRRTERSLAAAGERLQRERQLAATQWAGLEGHPPARRLMMVRNDARLHHWGLFDRLLAKSRETLESDGAAAAASAAAGLAELALAVAERLDPEVYGEERVCDFKTEALAVLGDARRLAGDFAGARLAFSQARIHLEMGTGDLLEEAGLLGGLVKLLCDLGEYEKAGRSLQRAGALYRRLGDHHLDGMALVQPEKEKEAGERQGAAG